MGGHAVARTDETYRAAAELGEYLTLSGPHRTHWRRSRGNGGSKSRCLSEPVARLTRRCPDDHDTGADVPAEYRRVGAHRLPRYGPAGRSPSAGRSLSIPTWFYGHEPTNVFATEIAKYFSNALREDTLLHRCEGGVVFLPGLAGTVQEIFQAVTENFYAADASLLAPLILVGRQYWTDSYPAWPLLQRLGAGRAMGEHDLLRRRCARGEQPPDRQRLAGPGVQRFRA